MTVLIKRYANRKLYNTESSRYITLKGVSELVREGRDIKVIDNESGEEITPIILSQILVDDQKQPNTRSAVPGSVLAELVQRSGDAIYTVLSRSVGDVGENLSDVRDNVKHWLQSRSDATGVDTAEITRVVQGAVERVLRVVDLPTRGDLEALNKNLERLASALEAFESRLATDDEAAPRR